jgi:hypothetical protein
VVENQVKLADVVGLDWISHLGRPLYVYLMTWLQTGKRSLLLASNSFGSTYDALPGPDGKLGKPEIIRIARQKLLNDPSDRMLTDSDKNGPGILACLSARFALEFDLANGDSRRVARIQVERHMRLCVTATMGLETLVTIAPSEPLLAEAAREFLDLSQTSPATWLAANADLNCVHRGLRGELVAALLIMRARDASYSATRTGSSRAVSVIKFMEALLPPKAFEELKKAEPPHFLPNQKKSFGVVFRGFYMWFNHVIRIKDPELVNIDTLWRFITRGAMVFCADNQQGIDIVLPMCRSDKNLSRDNVTAILVQVKNDASITKIRKTLFDAMDPYEVGLFGKNKTLPPPVIRMVFSLGSDKPGVTFRPIPEGMHHSGKFTAYDVWCAGLSTETFRDVENDLHSYRQLLERTTHAQDLEDSKDLFMDPETKILRTMMCRRLEPLAYASRAGDKSEGPPPQKRKKL